MKKILLILALLPTLIFADAVIFSGNDVKALKQNLDLFGVVKILSGNLDPSVSGLPAPVGSQYNSTNGKVYIKKGVLDTQWEESQTGLINLSSDVSGVLPTSNGGTGSSNLGTGVVKASGGSLSSSSVVDADVDNAASINASKIGTGVVSNTEFNSLDGVGSPIQGQIDSKITGPASSTDNAIVRYDSTTGKLAKNSGVTIDDSNNVSGVANLTATGTTTLSTSLSGVGKFVAGVLSASTVLNADIASNAAIEYSKLAPLSTGQVLLGNAGVPTATTLSGGATVGATGVVTLGNSAVITQLLTGYASSPGTVSSADSIVQAIQKIDGNSKLKLGLTKSDSDGSPVTTTQLNVPNSQLTTSGTNTRRIETGNDNLLKNPSFEATTVGSDWTAVNGSCASSSGVTVDGLKNCLFTSSGTNWSLSQCSTTNAPRLAGQEMENSVWLGSASASDPIWVCPGTNGSYPTPSVANGCMQYTNIGNIQQVKNYFLGDSASASNCIRISGSNSGTTVGIDKAYTGLRTNSEVSGQANYPRRPYSPSLAGWGTGATSNCYESREGQFLNIDCSMTIGTSPSASEARLPLPAGLTTVSTGGAIVPVGSHYRSQNSPDKGGAVFRELSQTYLTFSPVETYGGGTGISTQKVNYNSAWVAGNTVIITARVPIAEWQNNINAFSTKCDDPRQCETVFSAQVSATGVISNQSTGTSFPWLSSCTNAVPSVCTYSTSIGLLNAMICNATPSPSPAGGYDTQIDSSTNLSVSIHLRNSATGVDSAQAFTLTCQKAGSDYLNSRITQQIVQMREYNRTPGVAKPITCSALISNAANDETPCSGVTCTISRDRGGCFSAATRSANGRYAVTVNSSAINTDANCWLQTVASSGGGGYRVFSGIIGTATRSISFDDGAATGQNTSFNILCHGSQP